MLSSTNLWPGNHKLMIKGLCVNNISFLFQDIITQYIQTTTMVNSELSLFIRIISPKLAAILALLLAHPFHVSGQHFNTTPKVQLSKCTEYGAFKLMSSFHILGTPTQISLNFTAVESALNTSLEAADSILSLSKTVMQRISKFKFNNLLSSNSPSLLFKPYRVLTAPNITLWIRRCINSFPNTGGMALTGSPLELKSVEEIRDIVPVLKAHGITSQVIAGDITRSGFLLTSGMFLAIWSPNDDSAPDYNSVKNAKAILLQPLNLTTVKVVPAPENTEIKSLCVAVNAPKQASGEKGKDLTLSILEGVHKGVNILKSFGKATKHLIKTLPTNSNSQIPNLNLH